MPQPSSGGKFHSNHNQSVNRRKREKAVYQQDVTSEPFECNGCKLPINDRFLLRSLDKFWHEDCLKCSSCHCRLAELGSTLFSRENLVLCRRDYLR